MANANNQFLFAAYAAVWIIFMIYAWTLARRQSKLSRDLDELKESSGLFARHEPPRV